MAYVAILAVVPHAAMIAIAPAIEMAGVVSSHWAACRELAAGCRKQAARFAARTPSYPPDAVIQGFSRRSATGSLIPVTGRGLAELEARTARRYSDLARMYERAKWLPWRGIPPAPPENFP
jgi:hypothetical protein